MSAAATNGPANGPMNGPANGPAPTTTNTPTTPQITPEMVYQHLRGLIEKLRSRMMKLINGKDLMEKEITRKQETDPTHRIQTLRRGRVINKGRLQAQKSMKNILRQHMIVKHDINILLKRYTILFKQANQMLASLHRSLHIPLEFFNRNSEIPLSQYIMDGNSLSMSFGEYEYLYHKIYKEYDTLQSMLEDKKTNEFNSENSNNNTTPQRTQTMKHSVRFRNSNVRRIPNRDHQDLLMMEGEPLKREGAYASSSGGSRRQKRTRSLRKKHTRRRA